MALSLFNSNPDKFLNLELAALKSDGIGKIISSPRVITANNVKAKIEDGTGALYAASSSGGTTTTTVNKPSQTFVGGRAADYPERVPSEWR